jgi:outer membrane lipoprotein LolB
MAMASVRMTIRLRIVWLCLALVGLGACSTPPSLPTEPRPPRESIARFALDARAAIRQADRADTVRIAWEHSPEHDFLGFASPLGSVMAELQRDARGARWLTADGERFEAPRPDELLARLTTVPVPLDALAEWMLGRVTSFAKGARFDEQGRLLSAEDRGWTVQVIDYESAAAEALPALVELTRERLRIRIKIEAWRL